MIETGVAFTLRGNYRDLRQAGLGGGSSEAPIRSGSMVNPFRRIAYWISVKHVDIILDDPDLYNRDTYLRAYAMMKVNWILFSSKNLVVKATFRAMMLYEYILTIERLKDLFNIIC